MKNYKWLSLCLLSTVAINLTACGSSDTTESVTSTSAEAVTDSSAETVTSSAEEEAVTSTSGSDDQLSAIGIPVITGSDWTLEDCIVLAEYKGLQLTETVEAVSEDDITVYLASMGLPEEAEEVTDDSATVEIADTVNISYEGAIDGVSSDSMTAEDTDLLIGSGLFIDGFEDGLIGMKAGETKDLELTFPDDYAAEDYAGQDVVFTVTVNSISRVPVMTNAWVMEYTDSVYTSVEEYRASVREELEQSNEESADYTMRQEAWQLVQDNCEFLALPQEYIEIGEAELQEEIDAIKESYSLDDEGYLEYVGMTEEELEEQIAQYGCYVAQSKLVLEAIMQAEGLSTDSDAYAETLASICESLGLTEDEAMEEYGEDTIQDYVLTQMVLDVIVENAEITETTDEAE